MWITQLILNFPGKMTSFEKETESLYAAGEVVEAAPAVASMSSRWNADLCGSLDAASNTPSPTTLALSPMIMVKPEEVTGQHVQVWALHIFIIAFSQSSLSDHAKSDTEVKRGHTKPLKSPLQASG